MSSVKMAILIPTYNEALNIERQLRSLEKFRNSRPKEQNFDVLVIDDQSPDNTAVIVLNMKLPWVFLESPSTKAGLGNAYKHGFEWALKRGYTHFIEMDADGSHRIEDLHKILDAPVDIDLVIGSRWVEGGSIENWSWIRRVISRTGNFYARKVLKFSIADSTSGFRRISAKILNRIEIDHVDSAGYGFQIEIAYLIFKASGKIVEVPICFTERIAGYSKMSMGIALEAFFNITRVALRK
jgi:dolichol-phosphate mannosyltransferase